MITYRSFLNTDPPALIDVWLNQAPCRSLSQVVNRTVLDQMVFAKPYFDPEGLILAIDDDRVIGFVHLGFAPCDDLGSIDESTGIVSQLRVVDREDKKEVALGLWSRAKSYFEKHQTKVCYAGGFFPFSPFYIGLYGGSRIPGIPEDDVSSKELLRHVGFEFGETIDIWQVRLSGFRPPVSRSQMAIRRQYQVSAIVDPLLPNWWECCTFGWAELYGFRIVRRSDQFVAGSVMFWDIQPLATQWGYSTMGLVGLEIEDEFRNQGLATFLVGESLRHLSSQGIACVEFQMRSSDEPGIALAKKLGFERIGQGVEMQISLI